ncbi:hypothetical protein [Bradyrhizobium sp. 87]|uniref:hypothetical protein n=1 Tax=Bradyrhizobium sp. 87 TaxID=2782682 RepID=UPI001FF7ACED|nr:hypothetical protein [Bradyrhizobium sp. 87]MCK1427217.1 hypothetical protein [Bradyrhizobium sp. 87]
MSQSEPDDVGRRSSSLGSEAAAHKLVEIASGIKPVQDGPHRAVNTSVLKVGGSGAELSARIRAHGFLWLNSFDISPDSVSSTEMAETPYLPQIGASNGETTSHRADGEHWCRCTKHLADPVELSISLG